MGVKAEGVDVFGEKGGGYCPRCGDMKSGGELGVCLHCAEAGYCVGCGNYYSDEVKKKTNYTCVLCRVKENVGQQSRVFGSVGTATEAKPDGWKDWKTSASERGLVKATVSLTRAVFEAGGSVKPDKLLRMSVQELLAMLGCNSIEFAYTGKKAHE